ncbi:MAG: nitroreductase family protein [Deltaproteobacteria bacterium]|jgi:nitroreductase|nr:nitroreductase family protein [Deltaproteobacteria bacterium]
MDFDEVLRKRRSTRAFLDEPISDGELEAVLLAGSNAPVGSNLSRDVHLIVLTDKIVMESLSEANRRRMADGAFREKVIGDIDLADGQAPLPKPFYGAPVVIIVSHRRQDFQPGIEYANVTSVVHTMHLAATNLGLGSVYVWGILEAMRVRPELDRTAALGLPEGFEPLMGLALGRPRLPLKDRPPKVGKLTVNRV